MTNYPLEQAKLRDRFVPRGPRGSLQNMFKCVFFFCNEIAFSARNTEIPPSTRAAYDAAVEGCAATCVRRTSRRRSIPRCSTWRKNVADLA